MAPPRQQTLKGALDWGYELLSMTDQDMFRRLSVFAAGWSLEAAEVVGSGKDNEDEYLGLMLRLLDKSLVVTEANEGGGETRSRMLEPVRQYASEKLGRSDEEAEVRRRHVAFFVQLAEEAELGTGRRRPSSKRGWRSAGSSGTRKELRPRWPTSAASQCWVSATTYP